MSLEHAILGFLNARARSGYDLKTRCFDVEAKAFWSADQAQIYRTLERLKTRPTRQRDRAAAVGQAGPQALRDHACRPRRLRPMGDHRRAPLGPARRLPAPGLLLGRGVGRCDRGAAVRATGRRTRPASRICAARPSSSRATTTLPARVAAMRQAAYDGAIATERATIDWLDDILEAISDGLLPGSEISEPGTQNPLFGWAPA